MKKAKLKFYDFSFILSHSNKGIKHSEDFDKNKFKREYLGRIIDNVDYFFHEQSCVHFIFINSHAWILFFINSRLIIILIWFLCDKVCQWLAAGRWFFQGTPVSSTNKTGRIKLTVTKQEVYCFISTVIQAI